MKKKLIVLATIKLLILIGTLSGCAHYDKSPLHHANTAILDRMRILVQLDESLDRRMEKHKISPKDYIRMKEEVNAHLALLRKDLYK